MRENILISVVVSCLVACTDNSTTRQHAEQQKDTASVATSGPKSIPSETSKQIGNTTVKIAYTAPAVRGRVIWGALVPYDKIWVTGAHNATSLEAGKEFRLGGTSVPAGKYALFTIPGKEEWTIILNKNWEQHQADEYQESEDVVRLRVKPQATGQVVERLKYDIEQTGERTADIIISWEKLRVAFPIEIR